MTMTPPNCQTCGVPIEVFEMTSDVVPHRPMVALWPGGPWAPDLSVPEKMVVTKRYFQSLTCGHFQDDLPRLVWTDAVSDEIEQLVAIHGLADRAGDAWRYSRPGHPRVCQWATDEAEQATDEAEQIVAELSDLEGPR